MTVVRLKSTPECVVAGLLQAIWENLRECPLRFYPRVKATDSEQMLQSEKCMNSTVIWVKKAVVHASAYITFSCENL